MALETNVEREFKFDLDADFDPPDLRPMVGRTERLPTQHLTTVYFDTDDLRLWARGITLRHRVEKIPSRRSRPDGGGKWTLKLPLVDEPRGAGLSRSELNWTGPAHDLPPGALALVAGLARRRSLEPIVVLSTERRRLLLHGSSDAAWGEIDDDLVEVTAGTRTGWRFRQLELELLGNVDTAGPVLHALRQAGATPGGGSKFALAAGLAPETPTGPENPAGAGKSAGPGKSGPGKKAKSGRTGSGKGSGGRDIPTDLRSVAARLLTSAFDAMTEADYRLRVPDENGDVARPAPELVERAQHALRWLDSTVAMLDEVLDPVWVQHARRDVEWLEDLLRRLGQEDAMLHFVRSHADTEDREEVEALLGLLAADRHLGGSELAEALASTRYMDLLDGLHRVSADPPLPGADGASPARPVLQDALARRRRAARSVARKLADGADRASAGHGAAGLDEQAVRRALLQAERLQDVAEATQDIVGKRARRLGPPAWTLADQTRRAGLSLVLSGQLRQVAGHPSVSPDVAFVAGRIVGRAEADVRRDGKEWRRAIRRLAR